MFIPKHKLNKFYIPASIFLLVILAIYLPLKLLKYYDNSFVHNINFYTLTLFTITISSSLFLFYKFDFKNKIVFSSLFFVLFTFASFSYYFTLPDECHDCKGDVEVGKLSREMGLTNFIKDYNNPVLYSIKKDPYRYKRLLKYDSLLGLHYKEKVDNIKNDTLNNGRYSDMVLFRTAQHSPFLYCIIGVWQSLFGGEYFSHVKLEFIIAILYLCSMFIFLGLFYKKDEFKDKLSIMLILILTPAFLIQATRPKNDLLLGIFAIWTIFFLLKNKKEGINIFDIATGICLSFAVLSKFTSLTLFLPVILYYLISFKYRAISKFIVLLICFFILPLTLYAVFKYDMLLNIISGSIMQTMHNYQNDFIEMLLRRFFLEQYILGIPFIVLSFAYLLQFRRYLFNRDILIPYIFICFFFSYFFTLWGSEVARHLTGYLPLAIPMIVIIYKNCSEQKKLLFATAILLLMNNYLIFLNRYTEMNTLKKIHWSFW